AAKTTEVDCNSTHAAGGNFPMCLLPDSTEPIGQNGLSCARRSNWQKVPQSCSKNPEEAFPTSIFAGLAPGKKSVARPRVCRDLQRTLSLAIRFSAKWKCAEARTRQSVSIF